MTGAGDAAVRRHEQALSSWSLPSCGLDIDKSTHGILSSSDKCCDENKARYRELL